MMKILFVFLGATLSFNTSAKDFNYYSENLNEAKRVSENCELVLDSLARVGNTDRMMEWLKNKDCAEAHKAWKEEQFRQSMAKLMESNISEEEIDEDSSMKGMLNPLVGLDCNPFAGECGENNKQ